MTNTIIYIRYELMEVFNRTFLWPIKTTNLLDISYFCIDYLITVCSPESRGSINIRWAMWWGLMWEAEGWLRVHQILSNIVQSREFKWGNQLKWLSDEPIILLHEHESPEDWVSCIISQKSTIHHVPVLLVHYVTYIDGILNKDIMITLCNPQGELHFDWFDNKDDEEIINPVFLSNNDLDEVSELLEAVERVQRKYYQDRVNTLLSILSPYVSK